MDIETLKDLISVEFHDRLENILEMCNAPYAVSSGIELVSVDKDSVRMRKTIRDQDLNSNGVVHGAVSFGLIDHTFAVISNTTIPTVGQSCNVVYHRPCTGPIMEAEAKILNESRSLFTVEVLLHSNGKLIASATCIGFKAKRDQ